MEGAMKKLFLLALIVLAAWTAWKRYPDVMSHKPTHEAIIENDTGEAISSVRFSVGHQTFVREQLAAGDKATFAFRVNRDETFELTWAAKGGAADMRWQGGSATAGPIVARHRMTLHDDGGVIYRAEPFTSAP
jgi:hypothetical protein